MELPSKEIVKAMGDGAVGKIKGSVWNMLHLRYPLDIQGNRSIKNTVLPSEHHAGWFP